MPQKKMKSSETTATGTHRFPSFQDAVNSRDAQKTKRRPPLPDADFEETVENFDISLISSSYTGKKEPLFNGAFVVRLFLLVLCASLFLYSVLSIAQRIAADIENKNLMEDLAETTQRQSAVARVAKPGGTPSSLTLYDTLGVTEYEKEFTHEETDFTGKYDTVRYTIADLKKENSDIYGWIRLKGGMSGINYPIVKSSDNNFYLYRNIYKKSSPAGSIFADFRNSFDHKDNYNTIFYGHCMTNGTMFRAIMDWYDSPTRNALADQISIEIITPDAVYVYDVFAAYRSSGADFITVSFPNNSEYLSFLSSLQKKSVLKRDVNFDINSRIITLSTCTNVKSNPDERYVVHGILAKIIKYS